MNEFKRADLILMAFFVLLAAALFVRNASHKDEIPKLIEIRRASAEPSYVSLGEDAIINLSQKDFYNVIKIEDGVVYMLYANCKDQLCVRRGPVSEVGEALVCLPHRLSIRIIGEKEEEGEYDALSQ